MFPTGGKKNTIQHLVGAFPVRTLARFCGAMNVTYIPKHSHIKKPILKLSLPNGLINIGKPLPPYLIDAKQNERTFLTQNTKDIVKL